MVLGCCDVQDGWLLSIALMLSFRLFGGKSSLLKCLVLFKARGLSSSPSSDRFLLFIRPAEPLDPYEDVCGGAIDAAGLSSRLG